MHLKGEPEPLDFEAFFSDLFDDEFCTWVEKPSGLTCSTMASNALNCFQVSESVELMEFVMKVAEIPFMPCNIIARVC